ncbi:hypothetical protein GCM10011586_37230 [Silvibacterium dinghuense]|nr:hypothetical protein GCM10011586_37230 [Silvibacterium dinghuense]
MRSTVVFAVGSAVLFGAMYALVAQAVHERGDSWLIGESETLRQVALTTPRDSLYDRILEEVAEIATQELAFDGRGHRTANVVFILLKDESGKAPLWVGPKDASDFEPEIATLHLQHHQAAFLHVPGWKLPFRVVAADIDPPGTSPAADGRIYIGLLDTAAHRLLLNLRLWFVFAWCLMVGFGFLIALLSLQRMLNRVDAITRAAAGIDTADLSTRVPPYEQPNDEVARLTRTFNTMLDRISASVNQLRTVTDSVAHDMKSPITSIRGGLESALSTEDQELSREYVAHSLEHLDRLTEIVTTTLDVAEAEAGALRLHRTPVVLGDLLRRLGELYLPAFADREQTLTLALDDGLVAQADVRFLNRVFSNLMENELRYAGEGAQIWLSLQVASGMAVIVMEDNGPGFPPEMTERVFERFAKGMDSEGHGLGLAFVKAVMVAHGGMARAEHADAGVRIVLEIPVLPPGEAASLLAQQKDGKLQTLLS